MHHRIQAAKKYPLLPEARLIETFQSAHERIPGGCFYLPCHCEAQSLPHDHAYDQWERKFLEIHCFRPFIV
jgi:hypothetical protein